MTERLRTAIKFTITELTTLLQSTPEKLLEDINRGTFTDPDEPSHSCFSCTRDAIYIIESLQETLNLVLDARKRLIQLGFYSLGITDEEGKGRRQEIQIRARNEVPCKVEKDEHPDNHPTHIPPDTQVEI